MPSKMYKSKANKNSMASKLKDSKSRVKKKKADVDRKIQALRYSGEYVSPEREAKLRKKHRTSLGLK